MKGRKPPSWEATSAPLTKTRARWVTEPKRRTTSPPCHSPGTKKSVSYQKSPQYSRLSLSVNRSQKDDGTGMDTGSGRAWVQPAARPALSGSKRNFHMPSRLTARRDAEFTGYKSEFSIGNSPVICGLRRRAERLRSRRGIFLFYSPTAGGNVC